MKLQTVTFLSHVLLLMCFGTSISSAQQHRATRLGNPATRFALPLHQPEDLRSMLCSNRIREDVDFIARESGYRGRPEDLRAAASNAVIVEIAIPVGTRLPAMSSRKNGKPVLLRDVLWAGKEPIDAYEFFFASQGRRYRLVSPKACANFWIEDFGPEGKAVLQLACATPEAALPNRPVEVCYSISNSGDAPSFEGELHLAIPTNATFASATAGGIVRNQALVWPVAAIAPGSNHQFCATFSSPTPGQLAFDAGYSSGPTTNQTQCATTIRGIPAVLLEVIDLDDPIEVGKTETYEIKVFNQGSEPLTNVKIVCELHSAQEFESGSGTSAISASAQTLNSEGIALLSPKETATWKVLVRTLQAGDVRFRTELQCDQFATPIREDEATQQY